MEVGGCKKRGRGNVQSNPHTTRALIFALAHTLIAPKSRKIVVLRALEERRASSSVQASLLKVLCSRFRGGK